MFGPISGRLSDRVGTQWPSAVGMASSAAGMFLFSRMGVDSHPVHVVTGMALTGMGFGLFSAATTSAIMGSTGGRGYGIATAFLNLARTSANVTGVALATTIVTFTMGSLGYEPSLAAVTEDGGEGVKSAFVSGMSRAFAIAGALMVLSIVLSVLRGEPQPDDEEHTVMEPKAEARKGRVEIASRNQETRCDEHGYRSWTGRIAGPLVRRAGGAIPGGRAPRLHERLDPGGARPRRLPDVRAALGREPRGRARGHRHRA